MIERLTSPYASHTGIDVTPPAERFVHQQGNKARYTLYISAPHLSHLSFEHVPVLTFISLLALSIMADPVSVIGLAISVAAAGASLSLALFDVAHTFKKAPEEIADIAEELSTLSSILTHLGDVLKASLHLCKPQLFERTESILKRFQDVKNELRKITGTKKKLKRLKWFFEAPKAKALLKKIESIKTALTLVLNIICLAREQADS